MAEHDSVGPLRAAGLDVREVHNHEPSWWLEQATRTAIRKAERCAHLADLEPLAWAIVKSGQDVTPCGVLYLGARQAACGECCATVADQIGIHRTCDRCRACGPTEWAWIPCGPLVVMFGLCAPCMAREVPSN